MNDKLSMIKAQMLAACTTIYDEESMTSLELSARTACKVNEVVKLVNMLVESFDDIVNEHINKLIDNGTFRIENNSLVLEKAGDTDE